MLQNEFFYHNTTRKLVTTFGNMFNDIVVRRFNAEGVKMTNLPVPIEYGSKQKYIIRNARQNEGEKIQIQLPRMHFLLTNISYEPERKINPTNQNVHRKSAGAVKTQFVPIPMRLDFELGIMARTQDDALQIVEQIIPYFTPSFVNEVKLFPEMDREYDCRTTLESINQQDDFEGTSEETKIITWTLQFVMHVWYAGPISSNGLIKRVQVDIIPVSDDNFEQFSAHSRIVTTPGLTADGQPTSDPTLTVPYSEINPEDPYGFITEIDFYTERQD